MVLRILFGVIVARSDGTHCTFLSALRRRAMFRPSFLTPHITSLFFRLSLLQCVCVWVRAKMRCKSKHTPEASTKSQISLHTKVITKVITLLAFFQSVCACVISCRAMPILHIFSSVFSFFACIISPRRSALFSHHHHHHHSTVCAQKCKSLSFSLRCAHTRSSF